MARGGQGFGERPEQKERVWQNPYIDFPLDSVTAGNFTDYVAWYIASIYARLKPFKLSSKHAEYTRYVKLGGISANIVNCLINIDFLDERNKAEALEVSPETFYQIKATLNFLLESLTEASKPPSEGDIHPEVKQELDEMITIVEEALALTNGHYETELNQGTINGDFLLSSTLNIYKCVAKIGEKTNTYLAQNSSKLYEFCSPKYDSAVQFIFWHQLYCLLNVIESIKLRDLFESPVQFQDNILYALLEKPFNIDEYLSTVLLTLFAIIDASSDDLDYKISNIPEAIRQLLADPTLASIPLNQSELTTYYRIQDIRQARPNQIISSKMAKAFIEVEDLLAEAAANGDLLAIATELGLSLDNQERQSRNPAILKIAQNMLWLGGFMDEIRNKITDIQNQFALQAAVLPAALIALRPQVILQETTTAKALLDMYLQWLKYNKNQVTDSLLPHELKKLRKFLAIVDKIRINNPECNLMSTLLSDSTTGNTHGLTSGFIKKPQGNNCKELFCIELSEGGRLIARDSGSGQVEVLFVGAHDEYDKFLNSYKPQPSNKTS